MTEFIVITFLLVCIIILLNYINKIKKTEQEWLRVLQGIKHGSHQKLFANGTGIIAKISYELNGIIENYGSQIIELKKADEANKLLLTSLSHDVRTPLASLLGYLEALDNQIVSKEEKKQYIEVAHRKATDLKTYIDMLFEWFKLNSGEQQFHFEITDINEATRENIIEWLPILEKNKIFFSTDIGDNDLMITLDRIAYKRILNNLFQNAIEHGKGNRFAISVKEKEHNVEISVSDNGHGIPVEQLSHIFERLYKCDDSRRGKGSGLGLAITKELVMAHKGEILVSSNSNENTVFTIHLPFKK